MTRKQKKTLARIIISAVLLGAAWITEANTDFAWYVNLLIFAVPYAVIGYDVVWSAIRNIAHGQAFDESFLMAVATVGAFGVAEYPEAVAVMLFYQIGELFQSIAVGKSRRSIASLMDIRPDSACVVRNGEEITVSPEEVAVGEVIVCRPGDRIPLDGEVVEGESAVNSAALTGESLPQDKRAGDQVVSGSINMSGVIKIRVSSVYSESTVARILELVENSSEKKAKAENFITKFARWYTPVVVSAALCLAFIPPIFTEGHNFSEWIGRALSFLVVSCPCALVVSVPLSFFAAIGGASRKGILVKGAGYLEALASADTVVFDKTGTLTKGNFTVSAVHPERLSEDELLDIAAAAESHSTHPIAESIVKAHGKHIGPERIGSISEEAGLGIKAEIDGRIVYVGNSKLMDKVGADWRDCHHPGTVVHIADGSEYMGHIVISDEIKPDSAEAISELKKLHVRKTVMLTGDTEKTAAAVASAVGVDEYRAGLLPGDKVSEVEKLLSEKKRGTLAFAGDGINDAPVLMRADIGIAMGGLGSDAAREAADIVLMNDKPSDISYAVRISRKTMSIVRENIVFALAVKAIILILSALGISGMWAAVFADVGVMVLAVLNAVRMLRFR